VGEEGKEAWRRWLVLYPLLAGLKQLIDPVLNDVVATLNAQCSDVGHKEQAPFLLGRVVSTSTKDFGDAHLGILEPRNNPWSTSDFAPQVVAVGPLIDAGLGDTVFSHFLSATHLRGPKR
jgi:hypothetical protein